MLLWLLPLLVTAQPFDESFEFALPPLDASPSYVDVGWLNPAPAADRPLTVRDGVFVDPDGNRVKLFGTNVTFQGAFPERELAEQIAARMRKLGFNVVRFHHLDNTVAPRGLWATAEQAAFDPAQMDKLDYFIAQLQQQGIYINLNLHVSRNYRGVDYDAIPRGFRYGKVIDRYHPRLIELQKQYATDFLTHRNPYTGRTYAEDPGVAVVEINNENSLVGNAFARDLLALPPDLLDPLVDGWHAWLADKYGNLAGAKQAWLADFEPLGEEMLANGNLSQGLAHWGLEAPNRGADTIEVIPDAGPDGGPILRATLTQPGPVPWSFQVHYLGLTLDDDRTYTLSFDARAEDSRTIDVGARIHQPDWHMTGLNTKVELSEKWRRYTLSFTAVATVPEVIRISFNGANQPGTFELANLSLKPGTELDLPAGATLADVPPPIDTGLLPQKRDWAEYIVDTEHGYEETMREHLKQTLQVRAAVLDTQGSYGGIAGLLRESTYSDILDMHAYWQHPHFPNRPWDSRDWNVPNTPMSAAEDGGRLSDLAMHRMIGMPFTVSEYDHPAPSLYAAEMYPLLGAAAAVQDWDGLYQFNYGSSSDNYTAEKLTGFFNLAGHPAKLVFCPVAALMFRAGAVPAADAQAVLEVPRGSVPELLAKGQSALTGIWQRAGFEPAEFASRKLAVRFVDGGGEPKLVEAGGAADGMRWADETVTVDGVGAAAIVGRIGGRTVTAGPLTVTLAPTERNFASTALVSLDRRPLRESGKLLFVISGGVMNQEMGWNETFTSVGNQWGRGPTIAEALTATVGIVSAGNLIVEALDPAGNPTATVPSQRANGTVTFRVEPGQQTLWYAVRAE